MATLSNFGIPGVGPGILHPKLKHRFYVNFIGISDGLGTDMVKNLQMQVYNTTLPNITWEEVAVHRFNSTSYIPGKHSWEPISMTLEDDIDGLAVRVLKSQMEKQQRIIGNNGAMYLPAARTGSDFKFAFEIIQMDGGGTVELGKWVCEGAQIMNADFGDRDYTSGAEAATVTVQLRFDHAFSVDSDTVSGTALGGFAPTN